MAKNETNNPESEDMYPCRIFSHQTLGGSMASAISNLKIQGRMNFKFENSFDVIPEGNRIDLSNPVEHINPAVDEVRRFMDRYNFRLNNGNVYYKPGEGKYPKGIDKFF